MRWKYEYSYDEQDEMVECDILYKSKQDAVEAAKTRIEHHTDIVCADNGTQVFRSESNGFVLAFISPSFYSEKEEWLYYKISEMTSFIAWEAVSYGIPTDNLTKALVNIEATLRNELLNDTRSIGEK